MSTALIVGAGPRLGGAIARRFAREGHDIALIARSPRPLEELANALRGEGVRTSWACADVGDAGQLAAQLTRLADAAPIAVAVHNVSVWREAATLDLTADQLLADVAAGAGSLLTMAHALAPGMIARGGGTILATGSAAADAPSPGAPTLGVQKAALRSLTQAIAADLGPHGVHCATVTVNGVLGTPGFEPDVVAEVYAELAKQTSGPAAGWRTVVPFPRSLATARQ